MIDNEEENEKKKKELIEIAKEKDEEIRSIIKILRELKFDIVALTQTGEQ